MKLLFLVVAFAVHAADFDCIVIGSSPFSLLEALYEAECGKSVLVLEADPVCGGAWKSIDICGTNQVDLGCHKISYDKKLKHFLETYIGCTFVPLTHPSGSFYFRHGCRDLIEPLLALLTRSHVNILTCQKAESILIDGDLAIVKTRNTTFSTKRLVVTPSINVIFEGVRAPQVFAPSKHYHLYLLVQDNSKPRIEYKDGGLTGVKRLMNLTPFTDLAETGKQLIILQTHSEKELGLADSYIELLKKKKWLDPSAYLIASEPYIYEAGRFNSHVLKELKAEKIVEVLETGTFHSLCNYIEKWQKVLTPYAKIFPVAN